MARMATKACYEELTYRLNCTESSRATHQLKSTEMCQSQLQCRKILGQHSVLLGSLKVPMIINAGP